MPEVHRIRLCHTRAWPALLVFLMVALASPLLPTPAWADGPFSDVPDSHPYADAIADLAERGIVLGYGNGLFGPSDPVLRQQLAKMIVLSVGLSVTEDDACPFADVAKSPPGQLYPDHYVAVAARERVTVGTGRGFFSPFRSASRYAVITMMVRAGEALDRQQDWPQNFYFNPDESPWRDFLATWDPALSPAHGELARKAEYLGLLEGLPLSALDPWGEMPRGEVAKVLQNFLWRASHIPS